jgi:hypothetical protein
LIQKRQQQQQEIDIAYYRDLQRQAIEQVNQK